VAQRTPLLRLNGTGGEAITLFGQTFGDDRASQWFRQYELTVNRKSRVRIEVGPPNDFHKKALHTMQLWVNQKPFMANTSTHALWCGHGISVRTRELPFKKIIDEPAEEVAISSPMLNLTVWSAAAEKFSGPRKQLQFAHLNVDLNWAKPGASGLLSELAGDVPMRRSSKMLLSPPEDVKAGTLDIGITGMVALYRSLHASVQYAHEHRAR